MAYFDVELNMLDGLSVDSGGTGSLNRLWLDKVVLNGDTRNMVTAVITHFAGTVTYAQGAFNANNMNTSYQVEYHNPALPTDTEYLYLTVQTADDIKSNGLDEKLIFRRFKFPDDLPVNYQPQIDDLDVRVTDTEIGVDNLETGVEEVRSRANSAYTQAMFATNELRNHENNKNNPHEVTAAQVGAATEDFVNSSIENMVARYISPTADMTSQWGSFAALQSGPWFINGVSGAPTNNDYAVFIETDNTIWRAKFVGSAWSKQYKINDRPFTAAELAVLASQVSLTWKLDVEHDIETKVAYTYNQTSIFNDSEREQARKNIGSDDARSLTKGIVLPDRFGERTISNEKLFRMEQANTLKGSNHEDRAVKDLTVDEVLQMLSVPAHLSNILSVKGSVQDGNTSYRLYISQNGGAPDLVAGQNWVGEQIAAQKLKRIDFKAEGNYANSAIELFKVPFQGAHIIFDIYSSRAVASDTANHATVGTVIIKATNSSPSVMTSESRFIISETNGARKIAYRIIGDMLHVYLRATNAYSAGFILIRGAATGEVGNRRDITNEIVTDDAFPVITDSATLNLLTILPGKIVVTEDSV